MAPCCHATQSEIANIEVPVVTTDDKKVTLLPYYASADAGCADLYNNERGFWLRPGETRLVSTGIKVAVPKGYMMWIMSRSGLALRGIVVANAPGVIDSDYRGEVKVMLHNSTQYGYRVEACDRIAQCCLVPVFKAKFNLVANLDETERGDGGFGSTGK